MGVGVEAVQKGTSGILTESRDKQQQASGKVDFEGTAAAPPFFRVHSGTETFIAQETGDPASRIKLVLEPSSQRREILGKTMGSWGLERRRAARELTDMWQEAVLHKDSDGFAVYVEAVISKTEEHMPRFRDIPNEDAFSGVVQLVRDAISGQNFERIQKEEVDRPITEILASLCQQNITMATYKSAYDILYDFGFLQKVQ